MIHSDQSARSNDEQLTHKSCSQKVYVAYQGWWHLFKPQIIRRSNRDRFLPIQRNNGPDMLRAGWRARWCVRWAVAQPSAICASHSTIGGTQPARDAATH